jgi:hypothetical protein
MNTQKLAISTLQLVVTETFKGFLQLLTQIISLIDTGSKQTAVVRKFAHFSVAFALNSNSSDNPISSQ